MQNSKIEWCDHTFNPWIGCTKVSPGCANCYAENRDQRFYDGKHWGKGARRERTSDNNWREPIRWNKTAGAGHFVEITRGGEFIARGDMRQLAREKVGGAWLVQENDRVVKVRPRVFCASLADWLDGEVPIEWLADLLGLIRATPNLDWLLLTKRPENFSDHIKMVARVGSVSDETFDWLERWLTCSEAPANVWIGTTVEDQQRADERIQTLISIPAKVRFLSCEPLLGPVDLCKAGAIWSDMNNHPVDGRGLNQHIHWVICGGESGPQARPMHPDWARSLRDQCQAAGVPFLFKQWGEWREPLVGERYDTSRGRAGNPAAFIVAPNGTVHCFHNDQTTEGVPMIKVGKPAAGRLLDGIEHNQFPSAISAH